MELQKEIQPNREAFAADPFGYGSSAWITWGLVRTLAGFPVDISKPPTAEDLKNPILWLTQAEAMSQAAFTVIKAVPSFDSMPIDARGLCDHQYCAVGLMLVGYSLEISLKAMAILSNGVADYIAKERTFYHHRLVELASFIPGLSVKDNAILQMLTHFTLWAGRYPDPGSSRVRDAEEVFTVSEEHKISGKDLFELVARVMSHSRLVVEEATR